MTVPNLAVGSHRPSDKMFCAMEWVAHVAGEPWSDKPVCVCQTIGQFFRQWNDTVGNSTRNGILREVLPLCIGTAAKTQPDFLRLTERRGALFIWWVLAKATPIWMKTAGEVYPHFEDDYIELLAETRPSTAEFLNADSEVYDALARERRAGRNQHMLYWLKPTDPVPGEVRLADRASRLAFDSLAAEAGIWPAREGYICAGQELNLAHQGNNLAAFEHARELMEMCLFWLVREEASANVKALLGQGFNADAAINKASKTIFTSTIAQKLVTDTQASLKADLFPLILTQA